MSASNDRAGVRSPGWWGARRLRAATRADALGLALLALLGVLTVLLGRRAHLALAPRSAVRVAHFLNELDVPTRLPDAPTMDATGRSSLFTHLQRDRTIVAFYAPWCEPCQKELPELSRELSTYADIVVVIAADENAEDVHGKLTDLGLPTLPVLVDITGQIRRDARVEALPTTFLVARFGAVLMRQQGYSRLASYRMKALLRPNEPVGVVRPTPDALEEE